MSFYTTGQSLLWYQTTKQASKHTRKIEEKKKKKEEKEKGKSVKALLPCSVSLTPLNVQSKRGLREGSGTAPVKPTASGTVSWSNVAGNSERKESCSPLSGEFT